MAGYPLAKSSFLMYSSSLWKRSLVEQMFHALFRRQDIRLILTCFDMKLVHFVYNPEKVGFLYKVVSISPSWFLIKRTSRKGKELFSSTSCVYLMLGCILLRYEKKQSQVFLLLKIRIRLD